jgi:hypothetical protein
MQLVQWYSPMAAAIIVDHLGCEDELGSETPEHWIQL